MFKKFTRLIFITVLVMGMVALAGNDASALRSLGGFEFSPCLKWNFTVTPPVCIQSSYHAKFLLKGGSNPHVATWLVGTYSVSDGYLVGVNPQRKDVLVGIAGLAGTAVTSPGVDFLVDQNGKYYLGQVLWNEIEEFDPELYAPGPQHDYVQQLCNTYSVDPPDPDNDFCDPETAFLNYWGLADDIDDLLNNKWTPDRVLITVVGVTGEFYTDCTDPDDPSTCQTTYGSNSWTCATDEDPRSGFPGDDGQVIYVCNEKGLPIAFDDAYTARKNKTLTVSAPGVLENDRDYETPPDTLQVKRVNGDDLVSGSATVSTANGEVTMRADGGFTYTPADGFTQGVDTFTYVAFDEDGESNEALVTITVK